MLLLLPITSPVIIHVAYTISGISDLDPLSLEYQDVLKIVTSQTQSVILITKEVEDVVVNNETVKEVTVSVRTGNAYGSVKVSIPATLLNKSEENSLTTFTYSASFPEDQWDTVWFCIPPGSSEQWVKYPHPNHYTRYYPGQINLPWVLPDENYQINETFHPQYKHLHFTPGMTDELGRNIVYAVAYGSFVIGGLSR